ncbi:hypothetical protein ACFUIY_26050 [Streptomyces griseorubiginosus]|uniref:hypothetical protein n=1 Tax=Streptomyces griseorubiginosus TaxID=67304 RepID=UPI003642119A
MQFSNLGGEIVIEANSAGLKPLAGHLLTLAQDGTPTVLTSTWRRTTGSKKVPACDSVVAPHPTAFAIVRYEGLPAALRSCRSSWANRATGPADGSTGLSGRPMGSYLRP